MSERPTKNGPVTGDTRTRRLTTKRPPRLTQQADLAADTPQIALLHPTRDARLRSAAQPLCPRSAPTPVHPPLPVSSNSSAARTRPRSVLRTPDPGPGPTRPGREAPQDGRSHSLLARQRRVVAQSPIPFVLLTAPPVSLSFKMYVVTAGGGDASLGLRGCALRRDPPDTQAKSTVLAAWLRNGRAGLRASGGAAAAAAPSLDHVIVAISQS
jgi:hypothetical protein